MNKGIRRHRRGGYQDLRTSRCVETTFTTAQRRIDIHLSGELLAKAKAPVHHWNLDARLVNANLQVRRMYGR